MTKTIVALYDDFSTAERVIDNLLEVGFTRDDVSVMANDANGEYGSLLADRDMVLDGDVSAGEGAGFGAVIGTLIGVGVSLIPGIGPVIGAGPLAIALTAGIGAAAGAITGGITAGLINMGVDEDDAHIYAEGIRRGSTLISLTTNDEWAERAEDIMNRYDPVDIDTRSSLWRETGWSTFDHSAPPYNSDEIERERRAYQTTQPRASTDLTSTTEQYVTSDTMMTPRSSVEAERQSGLPTDPASSLATPPGAERHHETSPAVDEAMSRDASGGDLAAETTEDGQIPRFYGEEGVEVNRRARTASRAVDEEAEDQRESSFMTGGSERNRQARAYSRSENLQDPNPTDTSHLNR